MGPAGLGCGGLGSARICWGRLGPARTDSAGLRARLLWVWLDQVMLAGFGWKGSTGPGSARLDLVGLGLAGFSWARLCLTLLDWAKLNSALMGCSGLGRVRLGLADCARLVLA